MCYYLPMTDIKPRGTFQNPLKTHVPAPSNMDQANEAQDAAVEDTAENGPLQWDAAVDPEPEVAVQQDAAAPPTPPSGAEEQYSVSVDEIRSRLQSVGISKSKDTVQRWCREGQLDCQRLGLMRRYFATEPSVEAWMQELQKKENSQDEDSRTQVHEASRSSNSTGKQVHAGATEPDVAEDGELHEAADSRVQEDAGEGAAGAVGVAAEREIIKLKDEQIESLKSERRFLRDELVDRRKQAEALGDVIKSLKLQSETAFLNAQGGADKEAGSVSATVIPKEDRAVGEGENSTTGVSSDGV